MSNKCPYCGSERIRVVIDMCGYRASCNRCGAIGMDYHDKKEPEWLIADFCHPAHLLNETGLIRLAPDEIVVKRATAEHAREVLVCEVACSKSGDDEVCPECEYAITDLTAALEREVGK